MPDPQRLFSGDQPNVMLTLPAKHTKDLTVIVWEIIASLILMWVICGVASDHRAVGLRVLQFCISMTFIDHAAS